MTNIANEVVILIVLIKSTVMNRNDGLKSQLLGGAGCYCNFKERDADDCGMGAKKEKEMML